MAINFLTPGNISDISVLSDDDSQVYFGIPNHGQGDIRKLILVIVVMMMSNH